MKDILCEGAPTIFYSWTLHIESESVTKYQILTISYNLIAFFYLKMFKN